MDNFLKYLVVAGLGAGAAIWWKQQQEEKSQPNPEAEIEAELARRNELDCKPSFMNYDFNRDD